MGCSQPTPGPGPFEPAKAVHAAENLSVTKIVALLVAALFLGLVLHPFQFSMTQLLEGYWGRSGVGLRLARWRIMHYRRLVQGSWRRCRGSAKTHG